MSEESTGALSGAASGAAAGFSVAGPWGAVIGGVIGGIGGLLSGKSKRQARLKAMQINNITRAQMEQASAIQRRDIIRNLRVSNARALAQGTAGEGEVTSSGLAGLTGSAETQTAFNLGFLGHQSQQAMNKFNLTGQMEHYNDQAGMYAGLTSAALSLGKTAYGLATTPTINPDPLGPQEKIGNAPTDNFSSWGSAQPGSVGQYGSFTYVPPATR